MIFVIIFGWLFVIFLWFDQNHYVNPFYKDNEPRS